MEGRHMRRRITVGSVETAGYISAHEYPSESSASSSQKNQLYRMEKEMSKRLKVDSCSRDRYSGFIPEFFSDNLVAVAYTSKQSWVRGFFLEKKKYKADVRLRIQLIDYSCQDWFPPEAVRPLPSAFNPSVLECQSMKIVLYGVEPAFFKIDLVDGNKLTGAMRFYDKDVVFIDKLFEEAQSIYFEEICRVEEFYFGNIILEQNDGSLQNLRDLLLQSHSAIKIPDFKYNIPDYIKSFRQYTSAFDHKLAVRRMLFPSISFSDVERSTDTRNHFEYYRCPPVEVEVPDYSKSKISMRRRSNSNELSESSSSSSLLETSPVASKETLPVASIFNAEQSLYESSKLIDKIVVVSGGPRNRFEPVSSFTESPLDQDTFQMLKRLQLRDMTDCQKYLVPAVLSGQNVTLIDRPGVGKTTGVLISLVSLMWRSSKEKESGLGARTIVVCPYSAKCELVQKNCLQIIQGRLNVIDTGDDPVTVNVSYGLGSELERNNMIDLLKGYDILACTPRRLLRLLHDEKTFHFDRLSHIVFDDMYTLLNSYDDEVKEILEYVKRKPRKAPQRIIISDRWMSELKPFIKEDIEHQRGSLLISGYKDAALFVRLRSVWTCTDDEHKKKKNIIEMLNGVLQLRNVVIVFSDDDDIDSVYEEIQCKCSRRFYKIQNFKRLNAGDTAQDWKYDVTKDRYPVLFCTDFVLRDLQIYEADYLIHYSLPKNKTDFLFRFSVLLNRLQCVAEAIMKPSQRRIHPRRLPEMCIYSNNKENDEQFPEIVRIMQQLGAEIPETERMRNILRRKELVKRESGLCPNFKEFGRCHLESRCKFRHIILEDDIPDKNLPLSGYIKVLIVYVYSATHYGVRILESATHSNGPWSRVEGLPNPDTISLRMRRHFFDTQNRKIRVKNEIGDIVAFERKDRFHRVQIIKFPPAVITEDNKKVETPKRAIVKFIDEGRQEEISTLCLMELPEALASIPPGIVDVFVGNLLPIDGDITWGHQINKIVRDQLMSPQKSAQCYFVGKVELALGRNMWLDSLKCVEKKAVFNEPITIFSVTQILKRQQLAISHKEHLPLLLQLCEDAGLEKVSPDETWLSKNIENIDIDAVPPNKDENSNIEETHPPVCNGHSEEDVLVENVDIEDVPSGTDVLSNENKDVLPEKNEDVPSDKNKDVLPDKNKDVISDKNKDVISNKHEYELSNKNKDACFEIIHYPVSNGCFENVSDRNAGNNNVTSNDDKSPNKDPVLKTPNPLASKDTRVVTELNSVSRKPLKPRVEWRQDVANIIVTIAVNSDEFRVQVTKAEDPRKNRFYFCAWMDDKYYEFSEILFRRVKTDTVKSYKSGVFIYIKMAKLIDYHKWEQLFRMKTPYRWVRMHQDEIDSSDDDTYQPAYRPARQIRGNICRNVDEPDDGALSNSDSGDDSDANGGYGYDR